MVDRVAGDRRTVLVSHPLHPFDARNFTIGELGASGPFSFDRGELAGAGFSADGKTMFFNIYEPGMTFAVTGPWNRQHD